MKIKLGKFMFAILFCVLFLIGVPFAAYGQSVEDPSYYGRDALAQMPNGEALVYAYDAIVSGAEQLETSITVYNGTDPISMEEISMVIDIFCKDHPEQFWVLGSGSISTNPSSVVLFWPDYSMSGDALIAARAAFDHAVDQILSGITADMSEYERELYLHDQLASAVSYIKGDYCFDAYGALVEGKAVCQGYAEAFQYLLQRAGIQSYIATGSSLNPSTGSYEGHAWNYVRIDGKFYHVDLTWNDQGNRLFHGYFNQNDALIQEDHVLDVYDYLPVCNSLDAFYYTGKDSYLDCYDVDRVAGLLKENGGEAYVYIPGDMAAFNKWFENNIWDIAYASIPSICNGISYGGSQLGRERVLVLTSSHTEGAAVIENEKAASCAAEGSYDEVIYCTVCGGEISRETKKIGKLEHTEELMPAVAASCTTTGLTEGKKCSACGEILVAQEAVPMVEHNYVKSSGIRPGCVQPGVAYFTCTYCEDSYVENYEPLGHDYEAVVTPATCSEKGYTTYTCVRESSGEVCGYSYVDDYTDMLPHTEEIIPGKEATETETGLTEGSKCSVCGEILKAQEVIDKLPPSHVCEYKAAVTEPTCTEKGFTTYTCECGNTYIADETPEKGHSEEIIPAVAATCTATGLTEGKKCVACGEILEAQEIVPLVEHNYVNSSGIRPGCVQAGVAYFTCTYCEDSYVENYDPLGHDYEAVVTPATCTEQGYTTYTCVRESSGEACGYTYVGDYTDALGHTEEIIPGKAATETETGLTQGSKCSVCGEILKAQEVIDKLPPSHVHDYNAVITEPTCTEKGYTTYTCSCGESYTADETPAAGHTEEGIPAVAATCTATGLTEGKKCSVCGEILVAQEVVPMVEHNYVKSSGIRPGCVQPGVAYFTCTYCEDSYVENYEPLGHEYEAVVTPATCTEKGYTTYTCVRESFGEVCGYTYVDDYTDKLPHTEEIIPGKAATETETGLTEGIKCDLCGEILKAQEVIDKLKPSHVHDYKAKVTAPTCTEKGYTTYTCSCGESYKADEVAAKGHVWGKWTVEKTPTSKVTGLRTRKCSVCGEVDKEVLNKLNSKFTDVPESQYYALPVDWAVQKGVTTGMSATTFAPDAECTRAQIVTFLWRAAGKPEPESTKNPFEDVKKGDYFYEAVLWAVENGITTGTGENTFSPDSGCTRAQVATFLWRSQGKPAAAGKNPFVDVKKGEYFYDAVIWAVENGVTTGTSATTFAPEATCTRGQIVTFLYRAIA